MCLCKCPRRWDLAASKQPQILLMLQALAGRRQQLHLWEDAGVQVPTSPQSRAAGTCPHLPQPLLPWRHPGHMGKGTAVVRVQHRAGNRGTGCAAAATSRHPLPPITSPCHPSPPTAIHCHPSPPTATPPLQLPWASTGPTCDKLPWLQEEFLPPMLSPHRRPCMHGSPTLLISKCWTQVNCNLGAELNAESCSITPCV